jgi:hypothetical protein
VEQLLACYPVNTDFTEGRVFVYSDPGSGLFFIQVIAAALLTVGYRLRRLIAAPFATRKREENCKD